MPDLGGVGSHGVLVFQENIEEEIFEEIIQNTLNMTGIEVADMVFGEQIYFRNSLGTHPLYKYVHSCGVFFAELPFLGSIGLKPDMRHKFKLCLTSDVL